MEESFQEVKEYLPSKPESSDSDEVEKFEFKFSIKPFLLYESATGQARISRIFCKYQIEH